MLPFIGYNGGDYSQHRITLGKEADATKLPHIFSVNWFRRDEDGSFVWPGFGENSRMLKWVIERIEGCEAAQETPIGTCPPPSRSTPRGWTSATNSFPPASRWTPRSGRRRSPDPGVVPQVRREAAEHAVERARRVKHRLGVE